jgi:hypothetical protein
VARLWSCYNTGGYAVDNSYESLLNHIEGVVGRGRATISADDSNIVALVQDTIRSGKPASFYLSRDQANTVRTWYWTPERVKASGIKVVSDEEKARIESELGIQNIESFRCTRIECENCGHLYGAFDFLQQGIQLHGAEAVRAVFTLENTTFLRSNPSLVAVCPNCNQLLQGGIEYDCDQYGGCCYEEHVSDI